MIKQSTSILREDGVMNSLRDTFTLRNGCGLPCVGFGTWLTPEGETAVMAIKEAIKVGYRHIDGAVYYGNEISVGNGIKAAGILREEVFITSKLWNTERGYKKSHGCL